MGIFKLNGVDYMGGGGGGNTNYEELTQLEYDALTEEEKNNGTIYFIKDTNSNQEGKFQPIIYSESEREIGVWTDGKPLYEKTLVITSPVPSGATGTIDISSLSVEVCLIADGYFQLNDGLSQITVNEDGRSWCHYYNDNIYYVVQYTTTKMVVRIRYTKTTDQPGSGSWTPQGVPAAHYNTDEQIIGTWIDGSTVYEKTYSLSSMPQSSSTTLEPNFINCNLISCIGSFTDDAQRTYPSENKQVYVYVYNAQLIVQNNEAVKTNAVFIVRYTKQSPSQGGN